MKLNKLLSSALFSLCTSVVLGQGVGINNTNATPDASAMLDVSSTNKGVLIPRISLKSTTDVVTIASPATSLLVYNTTNGAGLTAGYYYWDGAQWLRLVAGNNSDLWTEDATNGYLFPTTLSHKVGIGTNTPNYDLDVDGDIGLGNGVNGYLYYNGDPNTAIKFTNERYQLFVGSMSSSWIDAQNADKELTINENGLQRDFRVEGDRNTALLFADGSADRVGINTATPAFKLDVRAGTYTGADAKPGIIGARTLIGHGANTTDDAITSFQGRAETNTWESHTTNVTGVHGLAVAAGTARSPVLNLYGVRGEATAEATGTQTAIGGVFNATGGNFNYALITENGNVGLGTSSPTEQLDVDGKIRMRTGATNGYIIQGDANGVMSWVDPATLSASDADWYALGTNAAPTAITNTIYTQGSVGIGATVPGANLHVAENSSSTFPHVYIEQLGSGDASVRMRAGTNWTFGIDNSDADKFKLANGTALTLATAMTITTAENMGIGTTNPQKRLHVSSPGDPFMIERTAGETGSARFFFSSSPFGAATLATGSLVLATNHATRQADMGFSANGTASNTGDVQMVIKNNGDVGIANTSPLAQLHVSGLGTSSSTFGIRRYTSGIIRRNTYTFSPIALFQQTTSTDSKGLAISVSSSTAENGVLLYNPRSLSDVHIGRTSVSSSSVRESVLTVSGNGKVGILNAAPQAELDVNGKSVIGWHGNNQYMSILPNQFTANDDAGTNQEAIEDDGVLAVRATNSASELYAMVPVPYGYKVTQVQVYGNSTDAVNIYSANLTNGSRTSVGTGTMGATITLSTAVTSSALGTSYMCIRVATNSTVDHIYGARATLVKQ